MQLVFAGLFSAACTAFLIEVSKNLQQDWQRSTSLSVYAIYVHLNSNGTARHEVPNPLSFTAPTDARWINGLWFSSLTLSLAVSLLAILAKQWLNEFKSRMRAPSSSPKMWAMRHSAYKGGLEHWHMEAFISTLPLLLHAALFLFLAGLCLLLMPLDDYIVGLVIGVSAMLGVFYILAGLTPLVWGSCPSATPMLRYIPRLWHMTIGPVVGTIIVMALSVAYWTYVLLACLATCLSLTFLPITAMVDLSLGFDILPRFIRTLNISVQWYTPEGRGSILAIGSIPLGIFISTSRSAFMTAGPHSASLTETSGYSDQTFPEYTRIFWSNVRMSNYGASIFYLRHVVTPLIRLVLVVFPRACLRLIEIAQPRVYAAFLHSSSSVGTLAFDQTRTLAVDEPLWEASIIAWMIRSLPSEEDVHVALCAIGWLPAGIHSEYFQRQKRDSPLLHEDLRGAAVNVLNKIAILGDTTAEETIAGILRACLFLADRPLALVEPTKEFLTRCADNFSHNLRPLSLSIIYSSDAVPTSVAPQPVNPRLQSAELIVLSGIRGRPCPRGISRLAFNAPQISLPSYSPVFVSTLEVAILNDEACRKAGWQRRITDDLRLRFISALDIGLRHSDAFKMYDWECRAISAHYGAAARSIVLDLAVDLPPDLQSQLQWTATEQFRDYEFSAADLKAIAKVLLLQIPTGRSCILPATLINLLFSFRRWSLTWDADTTSLFSWAFKPLGDSNKLACGLGEHRTAKSAFLDSHLSLLQPIFISDQLRFSPWKWLILSVPMSDAERLAEIASPYTVLLLVLHRRGYSNEARALLHELLPYELAVYMICYGTQWRRELALHAKVISRGWWSEMCQRLTQPDHALAWVPCTDFTNATEFVAALSVQEDCPGCAHDDIRFRWGTAPALPDANAPESELTVHDPVVWELSEPEASGRWYTSFTRRRSGARVVPEPTDNGGDMEMGPVPAGGDEAAVVE